MPPLGWRCFSDPLPPNWRLGFCSGKGQHGIRFKLRGECAASALPWLSTLLRTSLLLLASLSLGAPLRLPAAAILAREQVLLRGGRPSDVFTYNRCLGKKPKEFRGERRSHLHPHPCLRLNSPTPPPPPPPSPPRPPLSPLSARLSIAVLLTPKGAHAFEEIEKLNDSEIDEILALKKRELDDPCIFKRMCVAALDASLSPLLLLLSSSSPSLPPPLCPSPSPAASYAM